MDALKLITKVVVLIIGIILFFYFLVMYLL